jgi:hypothetical protein
MKRSLNDDYIALSKERLLKILKQILQVEDIEVKNCALESLIEKLEEGLDETAD